MWRRIFNTLKDNGLKPYAPGQHKGECISPYCVVKSSTQSPYHSSGRHGYMVYDIILFVPQDSYVAMETYAAQIRDVLQNMAPDLRKTGFETPTIIDDDKNAYTMSIEYQIMKVLEG